MQLVSLRYTVWCGLLGVFLFVLSQFLMIDVDVWHEMSLFRAALAAGSIPQEDLFAYTPTVNPSIHHEWGTGAVFYLVTISSGFGAIGLMALRYLLATALAIGCYVCARRRGASDATFTVAALLAIVLVTPGFVSVLRAQVFTLVALVCLLLLLEEDRRDRRWWLFVWLPIYVAWLNLHAGFLVGLGIYGLYSLESVLRTWRETQSLTETIWRTWPLVCGGSAMIALTGATPYGYDYLPYLWHAVRMERPYVSEWQPLWEQKAWFVLLPAYLCSLAAIFYASLRLGVRRLPGVIIVAISAWLALRHTRHLSIYAVVWLCYAPGYLQKTDFGSELSTLWKRRSTFIFCVSSTLAVLGFSGAVNARFWELKIPARQNESRSGTAYPVGVVDYLNQQNFMGNIMTNFDWGAFVMWKLHPKVKISMDSRYEVAYPPEVVEEVVEFYAGKPNWHSTLRHFSTDAIVVAQDAPVKNLLEAEHSFGWHERYRDDSFTLFVRTGLKDELPMMNRTGERIQGRFP